MRTLVYRGPYPDFQIRWRTPFGKRNYLFEKDVPQEVEYDELADYLLLDSGGRVVFEEVGGFE